MSPVQYYAFQIRKTEDLIRDAHQLPEYEVKLKEYARRVLIHMKGCHKLYQEFQELLDETDQLKGKQRDGETKEQFGERVGRVGQLTRKILEMDAKIRPQKEATSKAVDDLNKYTKKMLDEVSGV